MVNVSKDGVYFHNLKSKLTMKLSRLRPVFFIAGEVRSKRHRLD